MAGLGVHYARLEDENGEDKSELVSIDVIYLFDVERTLVGPEYCLVTSEDTVGGDSYFSISPA